MIVVSAATPLNVLVRIDRIELLHLLCDRVIIPSGVREELSHARTPGAVRTWIASQPPWIEVRTAPPFVMPGLKGRGEREAISLDMELRADLLLADEKAARAAANKLGLSTVGTLGVLELASSRHLALLPESIERISKDAADFCVEPKLIRLVLQRDAERRRVTPQQRA